MEKVLKGFGELFCLAALCAPGYAVYGAEYIGTGTVNWTDVVSSAGLQAGSSLTIYNSSSTANMSINDVNGDVELGDLNLSYIGAPTKNSQVTLRITEEDFPLTGKYSSLMQYNPACGTSNCHSTYPSSLVIRAPESICG